MIRLYVIIYYYIICSALKGFDWSCGRNGNFYAGDWNEMREIYHFVSYVEY